MDEQYQENAFGCFLNRIGEIIWLNILWIIGCLPIVTIGASTTAAFSAAFRWNRLDTPQTTHVFWQSYKKNLKQSTMCWGIIVILMLTALEFLRLGQCYVMMEPIINASAVFLIALDSMFFLLVFPVLAYFDVSTKETFSNAVFLMMRYTWQIIIIAATTCLGIAAIFTIAPPLFAVSGGLLIYLNSRVFRSVFEKITEKVQTK